MAWRDSQLRRLDERRVYRARSRRAWLVLGFAVSVYVAFWAAREMLT